PARIATRKRLVLDVVQAQERLTWGRGRQWRPAPRRLQISGNGGRAVSRPAGRRVGEHGGACGRWGGGGSRMVAAGYETASLCGCNDLKQPGNYHWPNDVSEHVELGTIADAVRLTEAAARRLDERWL